MVWRFELTPFLRKRWGFILTMKEVFCEVRMFVLGRVKMLKITGERFTPPKDFNFEDFMCHSFKVMHDELHTVKVRISPG